MFSVKIHLDFHVYTLIRDGSACITYMYMHRCIYVIIYVMHALQAYHCRNKIDRCMFIYTLATEWFFIDFYKLK